MESIKGIYEEYRVPLEQEQVLSVAVERKGDYQELYVWADGCKSLKIKLNFEWFERPGVYFTAKGVVISGDYMDPVDVAVKIDTGWFYMHCFDQDVGYRVPLDYIKEGLG